MTDGQDGEATLNVRSAKMLRILDHYHTGREEAEAASESEPVAEEAESVGQ